MEEILFEGSDGAVICTDGKDTYLKENKDTTYRIVVPKQTKELFNFVAKLKQENTKLKSESVCHQDNCKIEQISVLKEAVESVISDIDEYDQDSVSNDFNVISSDTAELCRQALNKITKEKE